jgi:hypothetical protein
MRLGRDRFRQYVLIIPFVLIVLPMTGPPPACHKRTFPVRVASNFGVVIASTIGDALPKQRKET